MVEASGIEPLSATVNRNVENPFAPVKMLDCLQRLGQPFEFAAQLILCAPATKRFLHAIFPAIIEICLFDCVGVELEVGEEVIQTTAYIHHINAARDFCRRATLPELCIESAALEGYHFLSCGRGHAQIIPLIVPPRKIFLHKNSFYFPL